MKSGKYAIGLDGILHNKQTGAPIPYDMPVFILVGKDANAAATINYYRSLCKDQDHREKVNEAFTEFVDYARDNPEYIKEPTT